MHSLQLQLCGYTSVPRTEISQTTLGIAKTKPKSTTAIKKNFYKFPIPFPTGRRITPQKGVGLALQHKSESHINSFSFLPTASKPLHEKEIYGETAAPSLIF